MNFCLFVLYYLICSIILGLVLLCVYRFILKRKFNLLSRTAEKAIEDYFNAYDIPDDNLVNVTDDLNDSFHSDFTFPNKFGEK